MNRSNYLPTMKTRSLLLAATAALWPFMGYAASVVGPADAGRVDQRAPSLETPEPLQSPAPPIKVLPTISAPKGSKDIKFTLKTVTIKGMHAFTQSQVEDIYAPYIGHEISLDTVWKIAAELTDRYHAAGYFLSQVTVPAQELKDGDVTLHVVEGYIGEVVLDDATLKNNSIIQEWIERLQSYRPLKASQIESVLLQMNDLPGVNLRAVLEPIKDKKDGSVRLNLLPQKEVGHGQIGYDNNGSRFLGPQELTAQYETSIIPGQQTSISLLSALPMSRVQYGALKQQIPIYAATNLELYASNTNSKPGYTLDPNDIKSDSKLLGIAVNYKPIRQREENLTTRVAFESRNTDADILGTPLTRDYIRALRANVTYQRTDNWGGANEASFTLSRGLNVFGASGAGDLNLSRAEATPDFTKEELQLSRTQTITEDWTMVALFGAQAASGPLYSSEEFGYGGQNFGRAYDDSEITGDQGIAGSAELRYGGLPSWNGFFLVPYGFYDIGEVWNYDIAQPGRVSGSSAGGGVRLAVTNGISANLGAAFPLTKPVETPLYGNGKNPRYIMQLTYGF